MLLVLHVLRESSSQNPSICLRKGEGKGAKREESLTDTDNGATGHPAGARHNARYVSYKSDGPREYSTAMNAVSVSIVEFTSCRVRVGHYL